MQIVIDIYEQDYEEIKNFRTIYDEFRNDIAEAIANGILLPKGHGRLISEDDVLSVILLSGLFDKAKCGEVKETMSKIPTILEEVKADAV